MKKESSVGFWIFLVIAFFFNIFFNATINALFGKIYGNTPSFLEIGLAVWGYNIVHEHSIEFNTLVKYSLLVGVLFGTKIVTLMLIMIFYALF